MAWTPPRTWASGEVPSAALFNEQIRDNMAHLRDLEGVRAHGTSGQIGGTAIWNLDLDEQFDVGAMHDLVTNNSRITAPVTGWYLAGAYMAGSPQAAELYIRKNGSTIVARKRTEPGDTGTVPAQRTALSLLRALYLVAGDYLEVALGRLEIGLITGSSIAGGMWAVRV